MTFRTFPLPGKSPIPRGYMRERPKFLRCFPPSTQPVKQIRNVRMELTWPHSGVQIGPKLTKTDSIGAGGTFLELALTLEPFPFFRIFARPRSIIKLVVTSGYYQMSRSLAKSHTRQKPWRAELSPKCEPGSRPPHPSETRCRCCDGAQ